MFAKDFADWIATQGHGSRTAPITIFDEETPGDPDALVAVRSTGGLQSQAFMVGDSLHRPSVQVMVREAPVVGGIASARTKAWAIFQSVTDNPAFTINSRRYMNVEAVQPPSYLGKDQTGEQGRPMFVFNVLAMRG